MNQSMRYVYDIKTNWFWCKTQPATAPGM